MATTLARQIQRSGTTAEWASVNPILAAGEFGVDKTLNRAKLGDGATPWSSLAWTTLSTDEVASMLSAAALIGSATGANDAVMTAVAADPESAFSIEQRATFVGAGRLTKVLGLGTSITAGHSTSGQSWVDLLPARLTAIAPELPAVTALNGGHSGDNSAQMLTRLPGILTEHPGIGLIVIEVSVNDGKAGIGGLPVAQSVANMQRMISIARFHNAIPIVVGTAPFDHAAWPNVIPSKIADANDAIRAICERTGVVYVDLPTKLRGSVDIWADGLHPSMSGQAAWAASIAAGIAGYAGTAVVDDFNRPDSPNRLGSSTSGTLWIPATGTWGISGGRAYCATASSNLYAVAPVRGDDQTIGVILAEVHGAALALRASASGDIGYVLNCESGVVYAIVGGSPTALGGSVAFANGDYCRFSVKGNTVTVQRNALATHTFTNSSIPSGGFAGLYHSAPDTTARWEDLSIEAH